MSRPRRSTPVPSTTEHEAALYDSVVVPRYGTLFARMLVQEVPEHTRATVLDVGCGTGTPAFDVLRRLGEAGRVIAIDRDPALVDLARRRALDLAGKRIFFKVEAAENLQFGAQVFDMVVGNLALGQLDDPAQALAEMRRVLAPGGRLLLTRALYGTFGEIMDVLREVALKHDLPMVQQRADAVDARYPSPEDLAESVRSAGFTDVGVKTDVFRLPFRSPRELFADPLFRFVGLPEWRWIAGFEEGGADVMREVERSLEVYFSGGPLSLSVVAGLATARAPIGEPTDERPSPAPR